MIELEQLEPAQLLEGCRNTKIDNSHEQFCFELFRRAIVEESQACWSALYEQYRRLVYRWTIEYARTNSAIGDISIEEMVQDAFTAFWRAYTSAKLVKANGLASILQYLKTCAWSAVQHALRKPKEPVMPLETWAEESLARSTTTPESALLHEISVVQFWSLVDGCCNSEQERLIARLRFVDGWKPRDIVQQRPDLATDEKEIFKLLRNLKDRIERSGSAHMLQKEVVV